MNKKDFKELLNGFISKGVVALAHLVKSKLLPKAEEKYCKVLQGITKKIANKTAERVDQLAKETDVKKHTEILYVLRLVHNTLASVAESLNSIANYISENVNFKEIEEPTEEVKVALADIPGAMENLEIV